LPNLFRLDMLISRFIIINNIIIMTIPVLIPDNHSGHTIKDRIKPKRDVMLTIKLNTISPLYFFFHKSATLYMLCCML